MFLVECQVITRLTWTLAPMLGMLAHVVQVLSICLFTRSLSRSVANDSCLFFLRYLDFCT
ncbi:hypothetical protein BDR03DRAFT_959145, partial [Suillus americanus]